MTFDRRKAKNQLRKDFLLWGEISYLLITSGYKLLTGYIRAISFYMEGGLEGGNNR